MYFGCGRRNWRRTVNNFCYNIAKKLHAKLFSYTFYSVFHYWLQFLNQWLPCVRSVWCSSQRPLCLDPQAIGSPLSTQMYILAQSHPDPAVLCLFSRAATYTTETRVRKKYRTRDGLKGGFYPSSRPPNGLPPRSCVIYVERALTCFCPGQQGAFSSDPLGLPKPARQHRVERNKSYSWRVRAASSRKNLSYLRGLE